MVWFSVAIIISFFVSLFSPCAQTKQPGNTVVKGSRMFQHFGCYNDTKDILSHVMGNLSQEYNPISACAKAAKDEGYNMFSVQNGGVCRSGSGRVEQFYQTKKSRRCRNGVGGHGVMDVYVFSDVQVTCQVGVRHALNPYCVRKIDQEIHESKKTYHLAPTFLNLFPGLNVTTNELMQIYKNDPVNAEWVTIYTKMLPRNFRLVFKFLGLTRGKQFSTIDDYKSVLKFMVESQYVYIPKEHHKFFRLYFMQQDKPFGRLTRFCNWREDRVFTDQRFAGINPMSIARVALSSIAGVTWNNLKKKLNDVFHWEAAVQDTLAMDISLQQAITKGHVFVLHYPVLDGIPARKEPQIKGRKLMDAVSPIVIFVSKPSRDKTQPNEMLPVAIQMGHTKDSAVYTPKDGDQWLLAKQTVQVADFTYLGSVEHLLKIHLFMEPICVAVLRHFYSLHPLRQMLQFHCRGLLGTNKFNIKSLTGINGTSDRLFAIGYAGGYAIMQKAFDGLSWDDTDFPLNIKKRGMDDKSKVPYFPYRDDGLLIYNSINDMVKHYVFLYYKTPCQVESDPDLQSFANEVSAEGTVKPDGGRGMIKHFPPSIKTRHELVDVVTRIIWTTSAQHSVVNYPSNYYGSYTPNMPTKLYNDSRVRQRQYDVYNLPDKLTATIQSALGMNLGSLRYDHLFDYGSKLQHKQAAEIVNQHSQFINGFLATIIESRNRRRDKMYHLPYPYLVPGWIANSIHT